MYRGEHTVRHKTQIRTRGISRVHHGGDDMFLRREPAFNAKLPRFLRLFYKNPVFSLTSCSFIDIILGLVVLLQDVFYYSKCESI